MHDLSDNSGHGDVSSSELEPLLDDRIEDLKHRLRVEAAVVEGAKNVIKLLQNGNKDKSDKKALLEVSNKISPIQYKYWDGNYFQNVFYNQLYIVREAALHLNESLLITNTF